LYQENGDLVIWDTRHGKYGHIAVANGEGNTSWFHSYDQNWIIKKMHKVKHDYKGGFAGVLRPKDQAKINGQVMKYRTGQRVVVNIPIKFTGAYEGDKMLVESNGYLFWIHKSVVKNDHVHGLATIINVCNGFYRMRIFEDKNKCEFDCIEKYIQ
jgi:hypothetical protein